MRQEEFFSFSRGWNMCFYNYNLYSYIVDDDFEYFCDTITEKKENALYKIDIIFTDEKENHKDWIELIHIKDNEYYVVDGDNYKGKSQLNFTELIKFCYIEPPKYIYAKTTLIPDEPKEKHLPIIEGKIYSLDFKHQNNHWFVDTSPFKDVELSYFATIWDLLAIIAADKQPFTLDVICTKKREAHEGWIELYENSGFTYHLDVNGLKGYESEDHIFLSSKVLDVIGFYPKYIYIRKKTKHSKNFINRLLQWFRN